MESVQVVGHDQSAVEFARERCHAQSIPFFRISPKGINVRIDQVNDGKLMDMIWTSLVWLVSHLMHAPHCVRDLKVCPKS